MLTDTNSSNKTVSDIQLGQIHTKKVKHRQLFLSAKKMQDGATGTATTVLAPTVSGQFR